MFRLALIMLAAISSDAFLMRQPAIVRQTVPSGRMFAEPAPGREEFTTSIVLPQKGITEYGTANMKFPPVLPSSELVEVRYRLPFGLDVAPPNEEGLCLCTKDGKGGEKVGDVLRFTTYWRGKQPGFYDVVKQSKGSNGWDKVVAALLTNDLMVTDEIVLVFERPTAP